MNEKKPKISVILPSLNVKEYIAHAIESVINQTLTDIEIICVDGGSDDGTLDILKQYSKEDERINVFLSNRKSYGAQVNQGLANANGEYISIVETDDYIQEDMLESLYNQSKMGYVDIIKGNFYRMFTSNDENMIRVDTAKKALSNVTKVFKIEEYPLFLEGHPSIWAAIYKRSFLINNNITFLEEDGGAWVDNPFFIETALKAETIVYTNVPYYYYRQSNENSSSNNLINLTIPTKRINDMFNILNENNCDNIEIKELLYRRLFRYIEIIMENKEEEFLDYETIKSINEVLKNVDKDFVKENLSNRDKKIYYKYASPLILAKFENR